MQTTVEFNGMFSYSFLPILFLIIAIIVVCIIFKEYKESHDKITEVVLPEKSDRIEIKNKYLQLIDKLLNDFKDNKVSNRIAFQRLSKLIRNFIFEMTSIKVQYYTLDDIAKLNLPILYELVSEYYDPEFSKISTGNIENSIAKTRKVVEGWN